MRTCAHVYMCVRVRAHVCVCVLISLVLSFIRLLDPPSTPLLGKPSTTVAKVFGCRFVLSSFKQEVWTKIFMLIRCVFPSMVCPVCPQHVLCMHIRRLLFYYLC